MKVHHIELKKPIEETRFSNITIDEVDYYISKNIQCNRMTLTLSKTWFKSLEIFIK